MADSTKRNEVLKELFTKALENFNSMAAATYPEEALTYIDNYNRYMNLYNLVARGKDNG